MNYKIKAEEYKSSPCTNILFFFDLIYNNSSFDMYKYIFDNKIFDEFNQAFPALTSSCYEDKLFLCKKFYYVLLFFALNNRIGINCITHDNKSDSSFFIDFLGIFYDE